MNGLCVTAYYYKAVIKRRGFDLIPKNISHKWRRVIRGMRNDEGIVFVMGVIFPRVERLTLPQTITNYYCYFSPASYYRMGNTTIHNLATVPFMGLKTDS